MLGTSDLLTQKREEALEPLPAEVVVADEGETIQV